MPLAICGIALFFAWNVLDNIWLSLLIMVLSAGTWTMTAAGLVSYGRARKKFDALQRE